MPLSPIDIHNKEFNRSFRGYNEDEVDDFLERVIQDYEGLIRQNKQLEEEINRLNEKLAHYDSLENSLSKSILVAQETAEELKGNARKEAQLIIREAEKNADKIVSEALNKARKIALDMEEMQKQAAVFRARFRSLVQSQLEMMESGDWESFDRELARREAAIAESGL
ncbi:DivIVA domain-containing protein [Alicyclobacillus acidoterrestris]|uniref:DivIVA domain-containing protein n=1 Tax=Alicyclobacillus acidoterrestris (strain ATCC 49025 / DSM 3922 / CIP 106132 / NCIMB 13137 / GD3B) TaxID=1356854 RepID=T0CGA9_ALIAG|nr:DivIVA domain-containing protein [Alicyclobacillus acidoterrestris]EPZ51525.1 septum formation initiator [Alicyclobacillus acidoterrestris ATCC 49025]UNO50595.1 DivIVA domain-containing protein [Alicyclobacillus acidoterrestris]